MIEVEKNFDLTAEQESALIDGAELIRTITMRDVYYDTVDYSLTKKDYWLRQRDQVWELKVPLNKTGVHRRVTDQYIELESEAAIAKELGLTITTNFASTLASQGYLPFANIVTERQTYNKSGFKLDFDQMNFGFKTAEIELMVETVEQISAAEDSIMAFANQYGLSDKNSHGKVIEFLKLYKPEHYQALRDAGVIR